MELLRTSLDRYFKARVANVEEAKDLTQEVLLKTFEADRLDEIRNLKSWVFTIAKNTLTDYYKKKSPIIPIDLMMAEEDVETPTSMKMLQESLINCMEKYIKLLDKEDAELLNKTYLQQTTQKELAHELDIPYPTLRSKVQRARLRVRKMFEHDCQLEVSTCGQVIDCQEKKVC